MATGRTQDVSPLPRVVLIDANVFFSPRLRDLMMLLHAAEIIHIHWTRTIESEWTRNVVAKQGADQAAVQACLRGMRDAVDGWEVAGYVKHEARFELVDRKDRHVAAAAYKLSVSDWPGRSVALITKNLADFPSAAFKGTPVSCYSPGRYLDELHVCEAAAVTRVVEACRKKLKRPPLTREQYVAVLTGHGCVQFARALAHHWRVKCPVVGVDGRLRYVDTRGV